MSRMTQLSRNGSYQRLARTKCLRLSSVGRDSGYGDCREMSIGADNTPGSAVARYPAGPRAHVESVAKPLHLLPTASIR
jgi:hypothetical protein